MKSPPNKKNVQLVSDGTPKLKLNSTNCGENTRQFQFDNEHNNIPVGPMNLTFLKSDGDVEHPHN